MKVNVGCGNHYANGWTNLDVVKIPDAGINPDVVGSIEDLPFGDGEVDFLYAGHCLEHLRIYPDANGTTQFDRGLREIARVLGPDGHAGFICPDVYRAIQWWKEGRAEWNLVDACLEGPDAGIDPETAWDGCFHQWNCHEQRLLELVQRTFPEAIAVPMSSSFLDPFPLVSRVTWQCAIVIRPAQETS